MKRIIVLELIIFSTISLNAQDLKSEIDRISGKYVGEWTTFQYMNEQSVKTMSWKDTLVSSSPIINDTIAYVTMNNKMIFDNPNIPPYEMKFQEGFEISKDNGIRHFIDIMGVKSYELQTAKNTYTITQPVSQFELGQLGIQSAKNAINTVVKVVFNVNGHEVHKISRVSTVLIEENGKEEVIQFLSMKGYHKKIE